MIRTGFSKALAAAAACALAIATGAAAQTVQSQTIIDQLRPEKAGPVTRSWNGSLPRGIQITGQLPPDHDLPRIELVVNFDLDSALLTHDGMLTLRALAKALADPSYGNASFQIGGHTDSRGGPDYNMNLSRLRAKAVVDHLVTYYDFPPDRLIPVAYGMTQPLNPANPLDPVNRRVVIVNFELGS